MVGEGGSKGSLESAPLNPVLSAQLFLLCRMISWRCFPRSADTESKRMDFEMMLYFKLCM